MMNSMEFFKRNFILLFGSLLFAIFYFLICQKFDFWYDELGAISQAQLPWLELALRDPDQHHPPLFYLILKLWYSVGTLFWNVPPQGFLKLLAFFPGLGTLIFLLRRSERKAYTLLLLLVTPVLLFYSQELRSYSLFTFLLILAFFEIKEKEEISWKAFLFLLLALSVHYLTVFYILFFILVYWCVKRKWPKDWIRLGLLIPLALLAVIHLFGFFSGGRGGESLSFYLTGMLNSLAVPYQVDENLPNFLLITGVLPIFSFHLIKSIREKNLLGCYSSFGLLFFSLFSLIRHESSGSVPNRYLLPFSYLFIFSMASLLPKKKLLAMPIMGLCLFLFIFSTFHPRWGVMQSELRPPYRRIFNELKTLKKIYLCHKFYSPIKDHYFYYRVFSNPKGEVELLNCPKGGEFYFKPGDALIVHSNSYLWNKALNAEEVLSLRKIKVFKF